MKQNARLIDYLESHRAGITTREATHELEIYRLSERIRELERLGYLIDHDPERSKNGARVIRYRLQRIAYG